MTPEEESRRGDEAARLLQHPLLIEAFELIEQEYTEQWKNSPARDEDGRQSIWLALKNLHKVKGHLEYTMETGKVAKASLLQQAAEAARNLGRKFSSD